MLTTRTRTTDARPVQKYSYGELPYTKVYGWTCNRKMLGVYKQVKDAPGGALALLDQAEPTQYEKGTDPEVYFGALDSIMRSFHDFQAVRHEGTGQQTIVDMRQKYGTSTYWYKGMTPLAWPPFPVEFENLFVPSYVYEPSGAICDFVQSRALAKLGEAQNDYAIPIAEMRETVKFLMSPVKELLRLNAKRNLLGSVWDIQRGGIRFVSHPDRSIADKLRKHSWAGDLANAPSKISDFWLSYRYGAEPLIRDACTVLEHAWHGIAHTRGIFSKRARYVDKRSGAVDGVVSLDPGIQLGFRDSYKVTDQTRCFVVAERKVMGGYWETMLDMGFSPFSAPAIAWELKPLSFVFDRFVNVGDWIGSLQYRPDTKYIGNFVSRHYTVEITRGARYITMLGVPQKLVLPLTWKYDSYVRIKDRPVPVTPVYNPRPLTLGQWVDHLTILWQRMPKFVRTKK